MQKVLGSNRKYTIHDNILGEGTFGVVYSGHYNTDKSCELAFKFLK